MPDDEEKEGIEHFPTRDDRQLGYGVAKSTVGALPVLGPGLQELIEATIGNPLRKRQEAWFTSIGVAINEINEKIDGFDPAQLANNKEFLSVVHHATEVAMRTHRQEKLELLRNAVINIALGLSFEDNDALQAQFMSYVETLSPTHVAVLSALQDCSLFPGAVERLKNVQMGPLSMMLEAAIPALKGNGTMIEQIVEDLRREGLIQGEGFHTTVTQQGMMQKRTTPKGDAFLRFVGEPSVPSSK